MATALLVFFLGISLDGEERTDEVVHSAVWRPPSRSGTCVKSLHLLFSLIS